MIKGAKTVQSRLSGTVALPTRRRYQLLALATLVASAVLGLPGGSPAAVSPAPSAASAPYRSGLIIVGFRSGVSASRRHHLAHRAGGRWKRALGQVTGPNRAARRLRQAIGQTYLVGVPPGRELASVKALLGERASVGSPADAVAFGETVILAVPWDAIDEALAQAGDLTGKVVIDTTNQFGSGAMPQPGQANDHSQLV